MITDPEGLFEVVSRALQRFDEARKAKANLHHQAVYDYCKESITYCCIASLLAVGEPRVAALEAVAWVKNLPVPNGLFSNLIKAVAELKPQQVPLLSFILSIPASTRNIYLAKDALRELFDNIEKNDEDQSFEDILPTWRKRIA